VQRIVTDGLTSLKVVISAIHRKPVGGAGGLSQLRWQKSRHRGAWRNGDGFSQYETTDVPMWPRPKTLFPPKKAAAGLRSAAAFR
jgi:hypothetical protein